MQTNCNVNIIREGKITIKPVMGKGNKKDISLLMGEGVYKFIPTEMN